MMSIRRTVWGTALVVLLVAGCATTRVATMPEGQLIDGRYVGTATSGPVVVIAQVTVLGRKIGDIELVRHTNWRGEAAGRIIPARIIQEQTLPVDAVTGATLSSKAIMAAVADALEDAAVADATP